eukprot:GHVN01004259.1.p1 GENE.GHVN01004259.1~~GHVN01004259.1.p1  ORF type:complete len:387 (+),score=21.62 GHVN01004259.1:544-1704(+)
MKWLALLLSMLQAICGVNIRSCYFLNPHDSKATPLENFIKFGQQWRRSLANNERVELLESHRVRHCAATTFASVTVLPGGLFLHGKSESLIMQGCLAVIDSIIRTMAPSTFTEIAPKRFLDLCSTVFPISSLGGSVPGCPAVITHLQQIVVKRMQPYVQPKEEQLTHVPPEEGHLNHSSQPKTKVSTVPSTKLRVAVLLSGGVDSTVALQLLRRDFDCEAFHLQIMDDSVGTSLQHCPWKEDVEHCEAVCRQLGVPLNIVPFKDIYSKLILHEMIDAARQGRTANPDVLCNSAIKFGAFDSLYGIHFDRIASGHYARLEHAIGPDIENRLWRSTSGKDQTYFLSRLSQQQLGKALFPLGDSTKQNVGVAWSVFEFSFMRRHERLRV